ncbi:conserved hypothetical protein [delta proteobacterium NaphS2]|nr:conserved hypothetical protein [delta proteobacterium NaphS2]
MLSRSKSIKNVVILAVAFLKPWNRKASDMWHFERFLAFNGWYL